MRAFAGVRGGGEYGEEWHRAGKGATKPNTWKDFIACAEYLVREKYTSAQHLAGEGASAGGILVGNSIAERPDLFAAAVIRVGVINTLRAETTAIGVPNIPEFGTHKTHVLERDPASLLERKAATDLERSKTSSGWNGQSPMPHRPQRLLSAGEPVHPRGRAKLAGMPRQQLDHGDRHPRNGSPFDVISRR